MTTGASYLYGVMADGDGGLHVPEDGLGAQPVRLVRDGGLAAIVSTFAEGRVRMKRAYLAAHERVVEAAHRRGTVLPVRFGMLMDDDDAVVADVLRPERRALTGLLRDLTGTSELRVRATYAPDVALREALRVDRSIIRLRDRLAGRSEASRYYTDISLGEKVAAAVARVREADGAALTRRLSEVAIHARPLPAVDDDVAVNAAFLIRQDALAEFEQALDRLAAEQANRLSFRVVGPLAPWDFVDLELHGAPTGTGRVQEMSRR